MIGKRSLPINSRVKRYDLFCPSDRATSPRGEDCGLGGIWVRAAGGMKKGLGLCDAKKYFTQDEGGILREATVFSHKCSCLAMAKA